MRNFPGLRDYRAANGCFMVFMGTNTESGGPYHVGPGAKIVDVVFDVAVNGTGAPPEIKGYQSTDTDFNHAVPLTLNGRLRAYSTGTFMPRYQKKCRLQTQYDDTSKSPWLGADDGQFLWFEADPTGGEFAIVLGTILTLESGEYPVEQALEGLGYI